MNIIILNIIQEILSTFKTLSIVRGQMKLSMICKVLGLMISTLATAVVLGKQIDKELIHNVFFIAVGTIFGSLIAGILDKKNRKPVVFKYTVKFDTKENKQMGIEELQNNDIDHISIGNKTIIAYANNKNESTIIKKLQNMIQTECITIRSYNIE